MGYVGMDNIVGQAEKLLEESNTPTHKANLDKDDFLKLLVAQLNHQDPMNPVEDKEFTAQLAQFSSLEQLTNINKGITSMLESQNQSDLFSAVGFIGKSVRASGYNLSKEGTAVSSIYFTLDQAAARMAVNIYDSDGSIVRTEVLSGKQAGSYEYVWDGKDADGNDMADGVYSVGMLAEGSDGKAFMVGTEMSGVVSGVVTEDGSQYLRLKDGRYINILNVSEVVNTATSTTTE